MYYPLVKYVKNLVFYFSRSNGELYGKLSYLVKVAFLGGAYMVKNFRPLTQTVFEIFNKMPENN